MPSRVSLYPMIVCKP